MLDGSASRYIPQIPEALGELHVHPYPVEGLPGVLLVYQVSGCVAWFVFPVSMILLVVLLAHRRAGESHKVLAHHLEKEHPESQYQKSLATYQNGQTHRYDLLLEALENGDTG
ncbi:MAG: hypothetical protein ACJ788_12895 [Ktedonobacteraceae bacterium]